MARSGIELWDPDRNIAILTYVKDVRAPTPFFLDDLFVEDRYRSEVWSSGNWKHL